MAMPTENKVVESKNGEMEKASPRGVPMQLPYSVVSEI
jgi:hypothetical protein